MFLVRTIYVQILQDVQFYKRYKFFVCFIHVNRLYSISEQIALSQTCLNYITRLTLGIIQSRFFLIFRKISILWTTAFFFSELEPIGVKGLVHHGSASKASTIASRVINIWNDLLVAIVSIINSETSRKHLLKFPFSSLLPNPVMND